ncbi:MAG: ATP-dependent helicase HrpB [Tranquillimonas sp.]
MSAGSSLPIDHVLPDLIAAMARSGHAVLQAPPGAGKTTRVPLALLDAGAAGRIVMLEPRRIAARAAAARMAETLGEEVGATVGYRIRGEAAVSAATRIEVVTEGILTRMIQSDPELTGIGCVIFDEFHERSLNADLGLALCLEIRGALRPDLRLLVMSATLDAAPVAELMGNAPLITSQGRSFPVETQWLDAPVPRGRRFEQAMADLIGQALAETEGGVLAFLPGEGEIRRVAAALEPLPGVTVCPLYGAMDLAAQRDAIRPARGTRKLVLSTAIAETSLTIEDVRVVVDGGRARRARFSSGSGMSRLVTERVSRAEAEQRRGRAGRVAPGRCYRLWTRGEDGALPAFPPAEIEIADLTGLALDLALWGVSDPGALPFLTPPPAAPFAGARALLAALGALDAGGRLTDHGRALAALPLHPRLAHMLAVAGRDAAPLAALLSDRDILRGASADLALRHNALRRGASGSAPVAPARLARLRDEARRQASLAGPGRGRTLAQQAALAYPDRIGLRRPGEAPRYLLSGGKGAALPPSDPLAGQRLIVVTDTDGDPREARIRQAAALSEGELRDVLGDRIAWHDVCEWSRRDRRVTARRQERLGAIVLDDRTWPDAPADAVARAMLDGVRDLGLNWSAAALRLRARVALAREAGAALPDMSDAALMERLDHWLLPHLGGIRTADDWRRFDMLPALSAMMDWPQTALLEREAPAHVETPLGRRLPIDYDGEVPSISVRLQEMFGTTRHPVIAGRPLRIALLSPAGRPVQVTTDLPGFWATSYAEVRKEMRGRYPKHPWPEDPGQAEPTLRTKRRGAAPGAG